MTDLPAISPEQTNPPTPVVPPARRSVWTILRRWCSWRLFLVILFVIQLLPIWCITYFPTQDGPAHIYNGKIFFEGFDHANFQVRQHYTFGYELFPNMLTHLLLGLFQQILPALIAEKLVLSIIISAVPLSMLYLLNSIERGRGVICLIGFTFAYHNLLHIGFYNFSLSVSLCLFTLGWWWRYRDNLTLPRIGGLYLLAMLTYISHFAGYMAAVMAILISIAWMVILRFLTALIRFRWHQMRKDFRELGVWIIGQIAVMIPLCAMAWDYTFRNYRPERENHQTLEYLNRVFYETLALLSYSKWHEQLSPVILWTTIGLAGLTVLYRLARLRILQERDALILVAGALVYLFFTLPWSKNDGGWVNDRLYILAFLIGFAWLGGFHKWINFVVGLVLVGISFAHTGRLAYDYHRLQPELRELASAVDLIEPHSTVAWDLNGGFRSQAFPDGTELVNPYLHALSYYGLKKDVALFSNYEAGYSYFLTKWGEAPRNDADYIVSFGQPNPRARQQYEVLKESPNLVLYRKKQNPPDMKSWSTQDNQPILRLNMLAQNTDRSRGILRDRRFQSGSFGWVRTIPRQSWRSTDKDGEYKSLIGDVRDRTFRVDLPNGKYQVTCYFAPHPLGSYQTCLIANDKPIGMVTVADSASGQSSTQTLSYTIDITAGQLTQVFYTPRSGSPDQRQLRNWALSGIEISQIAADQPPSTQSIPTTIQASNP